MAHARRTAHPGTPRPSTIAVESATQICSPRPTGPATAPQDWRGPPSGVTMQSPRSKLPANMKAEITNAGIAATVHDMSFQGYSLTMLRSACDQPSIGLSALQVAPTPRGNQHPSIWQEVDGGQSLRHVNHNLSIAFEIDG